jgi:hypothetical protein
LKAAIRDTRRMLQNFYPHLLAFHGLFRWVVLAAAVAAIFVAIPGWNGTRPASGMLLRFGIIFVAAIDLEFLLGLLLYFGASPITKMAFQNMAVAMKDHEMRFFAVEHTTYMFVALILAHVGGALSRKGKTDLAKYRGAAICYSFSLLLMVAGIPWWRPLLRLGS